jgi:hypothetical protein
MGFGGLRCARARARRQPPPQRRSFLASPPAAACLPYDRPPSRTARSVYVSQTTQHTHTRRGSSLPPVVLSLPRTSLVTLEGDRAGVAWSRRHVISAPRPPGFGPGPIGRTQRRSMHCRQRQTCMQSRIHPHVQNDLCPCLSLALDLSQLHLRPVQ